MALRTQSQCRATIEAFVGMKKPSEIIQQNNIAGQQQIINRVGAGNQVSPNELLEEKHGIQLDTAETAVPIRGDSTLGTVATINGTKIA